MRIAQVFQLGSWLIHTITGTGDCCRFQPTCSEFARVAFEEKGFWRASWLVIRRLSRCHPLGASGWDPVPTK